MNQELVMDKIRTATVEVFSMMLGLELAPGKPYVSASALSPKAGVLSFIGLAGSWIDTGSIACSPNFACQAASALLLSDPYPAVNEDVLDAIAEITNMTIGNVKTLLEPDFGQMGLSIPTVIFGRNFMSRTSGPHEWIVVPFYHDDETIDVQLCLTAHSEGDALARASVAEQQRVAAVRL